MSPLQEFQRSVENTDTFIHRSAYQTLVIVERIHNKTMQKWIATLNAANTYYIQTRANQSGPISTTTKSKAANSSQKPRDDEVFTWGGFAGDIATIIISPNTFKSRKVKQHLQQLDRQSSIERF